MSYRRVILALFAGFFGFMLWEALHIDTPTGAHAIWPLVFAIIVVLALPEKRFAATTLVKLVEAMKGVNKND